MCAAVSEPSWVLLSTVNVTKASPLRSDTSDTVPTFTPDTVTSLPGGEAAGFGEQRLVADRGRQRHELLRLKTHEGDEDRQHRADESGPNEVASAVSKHQGSAHLPVVCSIQGNTTVLS